MYLNLQQFTFRYKVWHYTGSLLHENLYADKNELYAASWIPDPELNDKTFAICSKPVKGIESQSAQGISILK